MQELDFCRTFTFLKPEGTRGLIAIDLNQDISMGNVQQKL
jgi:hypothetical protein